MRDPWWIFSCFTLFQVINKSYSLKFVTLIGRSTRFVIMVGAILLAISFTIMDILSSVIRGLSGTDGINPYWKLALVFKCLSDNILLDDFKSVLQRLCDLNADLVAPVLLNSVHTNPGQDGGSADNCEEPLVASSSREARVQPSDAVPDHTQRQNDYNDWYKARDMSANVVGKVGIVVHELPRLPS
ncbi:hypothetical protein ACCO45_006743 [Purpureocillium lilacinum]